MMCACMYFCGVVVYYAVGNIVQREIRTRLDLLSIPQSGEKKYCTIFLVRARSAVCVFFLSYLQSQRRKRVCLSSSTQSSGKSKCCLLCVGQRTCLRHPYPPTKKAGIIIFTHDFACYTYYFYTQKLKKLCSLQLTGMFLLIMHKKPIYAKSSVRVTGQGLNLSRDIK